MLIKRSVYPQILAHLKSPEITLIAGPRQCGKTFLMKLILDYLIKKGEKTIFLNLDIEEDKHYFLSQKDLLNKIDLEFGRQKGFVFIDEIQRKENAGLFLKGLYDSELPYKFIVSGSGSLELKEKIHESLAGRKKIFNLSTISFREFLNFKTDYSYEDRLEKFWEIESDKISRLLNEYLCFGGYPKVILSSTIREKQDTIREIFQSYVERDITALLRLERTEVFVQLLKLLSSQMGNLTNISGIANILGTSSQTVKKYLWYLEKTFIIDRVSPFTRRTGREISKSPVVYFKDIGLRNFVKGTFTSDLSTFDLGFNFQNLIFNLLKEKLADENGNIHYYRTKDGAEIDFIIEKGEEIYPLEVKYSWKKTLPRVLNAFQKKYKSQKGEIITSGNFSPLIFSSEEIFQY